MEALPLIAAERSLPAAHFSSDAGQLLGAGLFFAPAENDIAEATGKAIILGDGRRLGYRQYGDPTGRPLIYCHGFPATGLEAALIHAPARRLGVRVVAPDRPGFGLSSEKAGRTIAEWADDVGELADTLHIERFAILGVSGGGPYALACACRFPRRLTAVGLVGSLAPLAGTGLLQGMRWPARLLFGLSRRSPRLLRLLMVSLLAPCLHRCPCLTLALLTVAAPPVDRKALSCTQPRKILTASMRSAFAAGAEGAITELSLLRRPWGFSPKEIRAEVCLWHGEADATVPLAHGSFLAAALPRCRSNLVRGEGHFSLPLNHMETILQDMFP